MGEGEIFPLPIGFVALSKGNFENFTCKNHAFSCIHCICVMDSPSGSPTLYINTAEMIIKEVDAVLVKRNKITDDT